MGCTYFREQLYMCMCMYIFNPRRENLKFSKDIQQQNPSWMSFGWDVNLAVPCTSVNAGQVRSHTWGKCVRCCGLLLFHITSSINTHEQQELALEGGTSHISIHTYIVTARSTRLIVIASIDKPKYSQTVSEKLFGSEWFITICQTTSVCQHE